LTLEFRQEEVATLAVVDDRQLARQEELLEKQREFADAVPTQNALLLLVHPPTKLKTFTTFI
jgi:hypothetical protein